MFGHEAFYLTLRLVFGNAVARLNLADQLIAFSLERAIEEAGGDRSKVRWAAQPGGGRFTSPTRASLAQAGSPAAEHAKVDGGGRKRYCHVCYERLRAEDTEAHCDVIVKRCNSTSQQCSKCATSIGTAMRICDDCWPTFAKHV